MKVKEYLEKVAYKDIWKEDWMEEGCECWYSKFDGSYITHVGMEDDIKFLADREITEELTHGIGFSPKDNKWYGWSHRAIYGFSIGSECRKGMCHYVPANIHEAEEDAVRFYSDKYHKNVRCAGINASPNKSCFIINWEYTDDTPNEKLRGTIGGTEVYIGKFGKGEWIAKTMADAKQMAIDFCEGVS